MWLSETPRRYVLKRCRYSSLEKFEEAFDTALDAHAYCSRMRHFGRCSNFDKCRPEATGDVISSMTLDYVGTDVPASFGDFRLNDGRIIRLFVRPDPICAFLHSI